MSKHKRQNKQLKEPPNLLKNKSDEELIALVTSLQLEIGLQSFTVSDLILRDAIIAQLDERGYIVTEVLKIEHYNKVASDKPWFLEDEGEGEKKGDSKAKEEEKLDPHEDWTDN